MSQDGRQSQNEDEIPRLANSYSTVWTVTRPDAGSKTEVANPDPAGVKVGTFHFDRPCGHRHTVSLPWASKDQRNAP